MNYNCVITDDEHPALELLEAYISKVPSLTLIGRCEDGIEASELLQTKKVDILFLDIQMPELNGIDLLQTISKLPEVIITTAYRNFAVESFELKVVDYLVKPFSFDRFLQSVNKAKENVKLKSVHQHNGNVEKDFSEHFYIKANGKMVKVKYEEVTYIESMREYTSIFTKQKRYITNLTMNTLEERLPSNLFMRVHRSHIVGLKHIDAITGNMIQIGDKSITISASNRQKFFDQLEFL